MKKLIRILAVVFCLIVITGCFAGCSEEKDWPFNATEIGGTLKKSYLFKEENRLNVCYFKKDYYPNDTNNNERYIYDETKPSTRTIFIKDQITFEEAFENDDRVIDFETQMVMVVLYTAYGSFKCWIEDIKFENEVLEIIIKKKQIGSAEPRLVYEIILMEKAEINNTKVTFV